MNALEWLLAVLAGVLLALVVVALTRRYVLREQRVFAAGLLVAAVVYAAAAAASAPGMLALEWLGVAAFGAIAFVGLHRRGVLATGWILHVAWDLAFPAHHDASMIATWYPLLCVGFDLAVAAYLFAPGSRRRPQ